MTFNNKYQHHSVLPGDIVPFQEREPEQVQKIVEELDRTLIHGSPMRVYTTIAPPDVVLSHWLKIKPVRAAETHVLKHWQAYDGGTHYRIQESSCEVDDVM